MVIKHGIKWGLLLGIALVVGTQILTWLGLGLSNWFVYMTLILVVIFSFQGIRSLMTNSALSFKWRHVIIWIPIFIIISRYVFQLYMFVYTRFVEPGWLEKVEEIWRGQLKDQGMSEPSISTQLEAFRTSYEILNMFTIEILKFGFGQMIISGIIALAIYFLSKSKLGS